MNSRKCKYRISKTDTNNNDLQQNVTFRIKGRNMINFIGCITAFVVGLLLSTVESIGDREGKIITILGYLH